MASDVRLGILVSVFFHIFVVAALTIQMVMFPPEKIDFKASVRVDLVALPDILPDRVPQQPTAKTPAKAKPLPTPSKKLAPVNPKTLDQPKPKEVPKKLNNIKKTENKALEALRKIKAQSAIEKIKQARAQEAAAAKVAAVKKIKYAGNIISPGTELRGLNAVQMNNFISQLDSHVKKFWILPQWMAHRTDLKAKVNVKIDSRGVLQSVQLVSSSGDTKYDDLVMDSVKKADPFPEPPQKFRDIVAIKGIILGFPE